MKSLTFVSTSVPPTVYNSLNSEFPRRLCTVEMAWIKPLMTNDNYESLIERFKFLQSDLVDERPGIVCLLWEMELVKAFLWNNLINERPGMLLCYRSREGVEQGGETDHPTILIIRFKIFIRKTLYTAGKARITLTLSPSIIEWTNFLSLVYPFHLLRDPCSSPPSSHVSTHRLLACFALIAGLAHTPQTAKLRGRR